MRTGISTGTAGVNGWAEPLGGCQSLAEEAYGLIRRRIVACDIAPGEHVTEGQLVEATGIGKTPVREALQRLAQEGLVMAIRRQGYRVSTITLRDVYDLFGLRFIIEPAAAELAVGRLDLGRLRAIQARYNACWRSDPVASFPHNTAFHLASAQASGNARLEKTMAQLLGDNERLYNLGFRYRDPDFEFQHRHEELIEAFASNDPKRARDCAAELVGDARRMVVGALLRSPTLLDADITIAGDAGG